MCAKRVRGARSRTTTPSLEHKLHVDAANLAAERPRAAGD